MKKWKETKKEKEGSVNVEEEESESGSSTKSIVQEMFLNIESVPIKATRIGKRNPGKN